MGPSNTNGSRFERLVQLAARARKTSGELCGQKVATAEDLLNLYGVLRRVEYWGPHIFTTDAREEAEVLLNTCKDTLSQTISFLQAHRTMGEHEESLFGKGRSELGSFSRRQHEILEGLRSQFIHHTERFAYILILVSKILVDKKFHLTGVKDALGFAVDGLTARLIARGEFRLSMLARSPENEEALWAEYLVVLRQKGFCEDFLARHGRLS